MLKFINKKIAGVFIWIGVIAPVIGGFATLGFFFFGTMSGVQIWNLIDVVITWALAFGVYRKSRICACLLFVLNLVSRVDLYITTKDFVFTFGWLPSLFIIAYALGIVGTVAYHRKD
ncbi:hypothetical protein KKC59_03265 [bacterium]|nr:hypothetical protein [bacterium]MBU1932268.1 hypothetical protein [Patescibacteria group bacterium]